MKSVKRAARGNEARELQEVLDLTIQAHDQALLLNRSFLAYLLGMAKIEPKGSSRKKPVSICCCRAVVSLVLKRSSIDAMG